MNRRVVALSAVVLALAGLFIACGGSKKEQAASTTPIAELIQAGKPPVVMGRLSRGISPIAPTFTISVTNVSDCPVEAVKGTIVFFDKDDKYLPDSQAETGYSELEAIKPGEKIELQTMTKDEKAVTGKWILKEVVYLKQNPLGKNFGELPYKWTNPNFETELAAATGK
jgi:hypothetical protein